MIYSIIFFYLFIHFITTESLNKVYPDSCTPTCKEALERCITLDCMGARECKGIIDQDYPTCSRCCFILQHAASAASFCPNDSAMHCIYYFPKSTGTISSKFHILFIGKLIMIKHDKT
jgi:hypothetical protein